MDKISIRQIIASLNKGGSLPEWISLQEIKSAIIALKQGRNNYSGDQFVCYPIIEDDGVLANILFVKSSKDATMLLRLLAGDDE